MSSKLLRPFTLVLYFWFLSRVGGAYRAVVDYGTLHKRPAIESVPLPDIHSAFHWFAKVEYFKTLDLNQAYHLIPLTTSSKPLAAFCTDLILYKYNRVAFGFVGRASYTLPTTFLLQSVLTQTVYRQATINSRRE